MSYAFVFDASACSGCKACQVACKDKNNLPPGVLWRRVYEITGGSWQQIGQAWVTDVFAYNLTIACNHCVHPKCAGVCPTDAYVVREDGIVYIDELKCIGCGYCNWACPYAAPQFNPEQGKMAKCNFCFDNIDAGLPPACVAACPMRVLNYISVPSLPSGAPNGDDKGQGEAPQRGMRALWELPGSEHPFPLPNFSRTEPHLAIKPHTGMFNGMEKVVSNREEIKPVKGKSKIGRIRTPKSHPSRRGLGRADFGELPLVAFTLLGQMAAGIAVLSFFSGPISAPILIALGGLVGLAGLASLLHLGAPVNAWRAVLHLKKSCLSREILMFGLFVASWLLCLAMPGMGKLPLALSGMGLVYSMAQVYRLRSIPAWNTNRTLMSFAGSAFLLGALGLVVIDIDTNSGSTEKLPLLLLTTTCLFLALALTVLDKNQAHQTARRLRLGLIVLGLLGMLLVFFVPDTMNWWIMVPIFMIVLLEEGLGRWQFYEHLAQRNL